MFFSQLKQYETIASHDQVVSALLRKDRALLNEWNRILLEQKELAKRSKKGVK